MATTELGTSTHPGTTIAFTFVRLTYTTVVLYKRLVLGEPQRTLPRPDTAYPSQNAEDRRIIPLKTVTGKTGMGAGSSGGGDEETLMKD